jgi:hypothetical protein
MNKVAVLFSNFVLVVALEHVTLILSHGLRQIRRNKCLIYFLFGQAIMPFSRFGFPPIFETISLNTRSSFPDLLSMRICSFIYDFFIKSNILICLFMNIKLLPHPTVTILPKLLSQFRVIQQNF